jgi:hypothetical protein
MKFFAPSVNSLTTSRQVLQVCAAELQPFLHLHILENEHCKKLMDENLLQLAWKECPIQ